MFDGDIFLLDRHNNPGFSGGPVVFVQSDGGPFRVAAVVSGYQAVPQPVHVGHQETAFTYDYNTGIIVTHAIDAALKLIEQNPIGLPVAGAA